MIKINFDRVIGIKNWFKKTSIYFIPLIICCVFIYFIEKSISIESIMRENIIVVSHFKEYLDNKRQQQSDFDIFPNLYYLNISLDLRYQTFAAVYDYDLNLLTPRFVEPMYIENIIFDPRTYTTFLDDIQHHKYNRINLSFNNDTMVLFYQWFDSNEMDNHYLLAIGLVHDEIYKNVHSYRLFVTLNVILILFYFILINIKGKEKCQQLDKL